MLEPEQTNRMTCSVCGWSRIVDHYREYRGGHTDPADGVTECHEQLTFALVDTRPPEDTAWYEDENPSFVPTFTLAMWDSVTSYVVDDVVHHNGATYTALANNTNSEPPSADWDEQL